MRPLYCLFKSVGLFAISFSISISFYFSSSFYFSFSISFNFSSSSPSIKNLDLFSISLFSFNSLFSSSECTPGDSPVGLSTYSNADFPKITEAQIDLAVQALACNMTRVASIQLSHTVGPPAFSWAGSRGTLDGMVPQRA